MSLTKARYSSHCKGQFACMDLTLREDMSSMKESRNVNDTASAAQGHAARLCSTRNLYSRKCTSLCFVFAQQAYSVRWMTLDFA